MRILIFSIVFLSSLLFINNSKKIRLLNIYNEPLKPCGTATMKNGSWDNKGLCSELGGGVHQICIKNISNNTPQFSKKTGQSDWSDRRGKDNHCVCLGAWSLYNAKLKDKVNKKVLKCESIPKVALSTNYVQKFSQGWNKWNGLEINDQVKDGVEALVKNCYNPKEKKSEYLRNNYCDFAKEVKSLKNSNLYNNLCR